jgi:hypothetical protein
LRLVVRVGDHGLTRLRLHLIVRLLQDIARLFDAFSDTDAIGCWVGLIGQAWIGATWKRLGRFVAGA